MNTSSITFALATLGLVAMSAPAFAQTLTINKGKSKVSFVSEAPAEKIVGVAKGVEGTVKIGEDYKSASGTVSVPVKSMNTGNDTRDDHMRSAKWLNAKANPNISFVITGLDGANVKTTGDKTVVKATAVGSINVNGVSKPTKAPVVITTLKKGDKTIAKIQLAFNVKLADHKVSGTEGVVGNKVGKLIAVKGTLYGSMK